MIPSKKAQVQAQDKDQARRKNPSYSPELQSTQDSQGSWRRQNSKGNRPQNYKPRTSMPPTSGVEVRKPSGGKRRGKKPYIHRAPRVVYFPWCEFVECDIGTVAHETANVTNADYDTCPNVELLTQLASRLDIAKRVLTPLSDKRSRYAKAYAYYRRESAPLKWATEGFRNYFRKRGNRKPVITNAWLKFTEILWKYREYMDFDKVFLNAEFPGAFTRALLDYVDVNDVLAPGEQINWCAASYTPAPDQQKPTEDPLIDKYGFAAAYPDNWLMDNTVPGGECDMTNPESIRWLVDKVGRKTCSIYTHDAALKIKDADEDYAHQEEANAQLHLGCALAGLMTLKEGGFFLAKQFTMFDSLTIHLLHVYAQMFDGFYIIKPQSSRCTNSEVYLVGIGFRGMSKTTEKMLFDYMDNMDNAREQASAPCKFIGSIVTAAHAVYDNQIRELDLLANEFYENFWNVDRSKYSELADRESEKISTRWLENVGYGMVTIEEKKARQIRDAKKIQ